MRALSRLIFYILIISTTLLNLHSIAQDDTKIYIVYMGESPTREVSLSDLHLNILQTIVGSEIAGESLLHSYKRSFNGFAARLTEKQAQLIAKNEGVVSVFTSENQELHTTRSWDFVGFSQNVERSRFESDIIIGVFDTGIWPESHSFDDKGLGPPPAKWKGTCQVDANFTCNNKIIGAKYYRSDGFFLMRDIKTVRDMVGHGTHTASIAAGAAISGAGLYGLAAGTARGAVPSARLAVYKVCWDMIGCADADILAAFDDAIADGVDVISVSLGSLPKDYFKSAIAIGSFHAMKKGVLTVTSAGNGGPFSSSLLNFSPWFLTVGATNIDRDFVTNVQTGDKKVYEGTSINTFDMKDKMYPIIYSGNAPNTTAGNDDSSDSRYCFEETLDKNLVKGKVVFCDRIPLGIGHVEARAAGIVLTGRASGRTATAFPLPASSLGVEEGSKFYVYLNSTRKPKASISKTIEITDKLAPYVASYSSRGPNPITPNILKPDLVAPGTYILAAWPQSVSVSMLGEDKRKTAFNILSGTSMACPHASAAAAYVKSFHPTWSPAVIKSALMTTATPMSSDINPEAEFAYGAGQINPSKAAYPGLVYDIIETDYINFLCGQGYTTKLLQIVTGNSTSSCPKIGRNTIPSDLNYPAFVLSVPPSKSISHVFNRTVTNVGSPTSTYRANLFTPSGLNITVSPSVVSFSSLGEKRSFAVTAQGTMGKKTRISTSLVWDDGTYQVRSPIIIYTPIS